MGRQVADAEFKPDLTAKIAALVQRFAPDKRWHCDSLLQARHPKSHLLRLSLYAYLSGTRAAQLPICCMGLYLMFLPACSMNHMRIPFRMIARFTPAPRQNLAHSFLISDFNPGPALAR